MSTHPVKFLIKVKVAGAKIVFKEGWEPGVIATQEVEFPEMKPGQEWSFVWSLTDAENALVESVIEVETIRFDAPL